MKSRAGKRKRWLSRTWRTSSTGKTYVVADGFRVTVYAKGNHWGGTIGGTTKKFVKHSEKPYETIDAAKLAAFDFITWKLAKDLVAG